MSIVDKGIPCIGPATQAGCGAICPASRRGCYGCFGPFRDANLPALTEALQKVERYPGETMRLFRGISGNAPLFRKAADAILSTGKDTRKETK